MNYSKLLVDRLPENRQIFFVGAASSRQNDLGASRLAGGGQDVDM